MKDVILHLNYLSVFVVTLVGFLLGWLWYSPVLFVKPWMAEMKFNEETMKAAVQKGMAGYFIKGFIFTLLSTFGLAVLLRAHHVQNWKHGLACGVFIGLLGPGMRMLNGSLWENRSVRLQAIVIGHEVALYALQGVLLGLWH